MICTQCDKSMLDCRCPDALERLRWLASSDSPVVFDSDGAQALLRRITELEGERELKNIKP